MKIVATCGAFLLLLFSSHYVCGQVLTEDTSTREPFFKASKFNSKGFVAAEGTVTQALKTKAAMNTAFSLNWVINHKFVVTADYYILSTPVNIKNLVEPGFDSTISLFHQFAGLGFGYIVFDNKLFSFQPDLVGGWGMAKFTFNKTTYRSNFGDIIPALYGIYNASKIVRLGVVINYRAAIGASLNGLKSSDISGMGGGIFIRV